MIFKASVVRGGPLNIKSVSSFFNLNTKDVILNDFGGVANLT